MYKSADLKINITVSFDTLDRYGHSKGHFGVVFQGQSYCDVKSAVTVQNSQDLQGSNQEMVDRGLLDGLPDILET